MVVRQRLQKSSVFRARRDGIGYPSSSFLVNGGFIRLDAHLFADSTDNVAQGLAGGAVGETVKKALTIVAGHSNARIQGDCAEEGNLHVLGQASSATSGGFEDLALVGALGADKARHVLDDAENLDAGLATEINFLAHVEQADFLWRGNKDGTV